MNFRQNKGKGETEHSFLRRNRSVHHSTKLSTEKYVIDIINKKYPSSCYTSDTRRVTQVTNHVISHE